MNIYNSIKLLASLNQEQSELLTIAISSFIRAAGGVDVSSYAPGRINAWNGPKADLRYKGNFFQTADWWCPELHEVCEQIMPGYQACLVTYSGSGETGRGIALHSDQSYAAFRAVTLNLQTDPNATTDWFMGQQYPGMTYSKEQAVVARSREDFLSDRGESLYQFELRHGDVVEFNCKNPHAAHPGPGRYSINLWKAANTERAAALAVWQRIVEQHGRSGGGKLIQAGIEPGLPLKLAPADEIESRIVGRIRPRDYYERYVKQQPTVQSIPAVPKLEDYFPELWTQADVRQVVELLKGDRYRCRIQAVGHDITRTDLFVISGGQDGADQAGLEAARELGLPTGGVASHGWLVSTGTAEALLKSYGLIEGPPAKSVAGAYRIRTVLNAAQADGTILFGSADANRDKGSYLTLQLAKWYDDTDGKAWCHIEPGDLSPERLQETARFIRQWLDDEEIRVLNVAGNRQFKLRGLEVAIREVLVAALQKPLR